MNAPQKPPIGVMPFSIWSEQVPCPTIPQLTQRFVDVSDAIRRYREAGKTPRAEWLQETGLDRFL